MTTPKLRVEPYTARLARAVANTRHGWSERRGVLLTIESAGVFGQGEAAPLPGYSDDTLETVHDWLRSASTGDVSHLLGIPLEELGEALDAAVPKHLPSARFALETALLDLHARRLGVPVHAVLRRTAPPPAAIPLCALIDAELAPNVWAKHAAAAEAAGFAAIKVKVGRVGRFEDELAGLASLRSATSPGFGLRLDANGAFDSDSVHERLTSLAQFAPEFLEEPLPRGRPVGMHPPVPIALDESLRDVGVLTTELMLHTDVRACILKPGPLGGVLRCLALARSAGSLGIGAVVSHAFEGPVAFAASCELALALGSGPYAHGLAVHAALDPWKATPASLSDKGPHLTPHREHGLGLPELAPPARG